MSAREFCADILKNAIISTLGTALYEPAVLDKGPWGSYVMQRIICVLEQKF